MIVSASCFLFLGIFMSANMLDEKSEPYELQAAAEAIDDETLSEIAGFEDVINVTPILDVPYTLTLNNTALEAPMQGLHAGYIEYPFLYGTEFESSSVMPYVILNEAAAKELTGDDEELTLPALVSRQVLLKSETGTVTAKISGVFEDEEETPKAYISLPSAENLLLQGGVTPVYSMVYVQCLNAGKTESVTNFLSERGLMVQNINTELETKWEIDTVHITHLLITAAVAIFSAALVLHERKKTDTLYNGEEHDALLSLGIPASGLRKLNRSRAALFICLALITGFLICLAIKDNMIFS